MLLELQDPFRSKWRKGYIRECPDGRKRVDLFNSNRDRTTISYSRYLFSVHSGEIVPDNVTIDHVDEDKSNDDISNLQPLSPEENVRKRNTYYRENIQVKYEMLCPECGSKIVLTKSQARSRKDNMRTFCSRTWAGKFYHKRGKE